jgi:hypothetical protein
MTALRSYDHYAPDIEATVLPGVALPYSPLWAHPLPVRATLPGTTVRWSDGTSSETALAQLDGRHPGYALAPTPSLALEAVPSSAAYRETAWLGSDRLADVWAITQVLAQGYGRVALDELRRRLRRAGYAVAAEELTVAHAVAATQAAAWHVTSGRELDARHVNPLAVSHLYDYLLARAGVADRGRPEVLGPLGPRYFVAGVSAVEIGGAEVVDLDGRSLAGVVVPGQRFHLRGARRRITLRHGTVRARLLTTEPPHPGGEDRRGGSASQLVTVTAEPGVVVDQILAG